MINDDEHKTPSHYRYLPGDYVRLIYPELTDARVAESQLSKRQLIDKDQYIVCTRCRRPCAGTCEIGKGRK